MTVVARRVHQLPATRYAADDKVVALTFDEAPGVDPAPVLDALAAVDARATFFVVGTDVERNPDPLLRIVHAGRLMGYRFVTL